jgi:hypothetical protein
MLCPFRLYLKREHEYACSRTEPVIFRSAMERSLPHYLTCTYCSATVRKSANTLHTCEKSRICLQHEVFFSQFCNCSPVRGMEYLTQWSKNSTSCPKVHPDEHPQGAVHTLVIEECKRSPILAKKIV